jgi:hypothetical protein
MMEETEMKKDLQVVRRSSHRFGIEMPLVSFCNQINRSHAEMILAA